MAERTFKLLIVDDEAEIREGILQAIPWEAQGITVAGLASNGREALQMITEIQPDLILLDIRMPVMNGLEVLERLAKDLFLPKVIIISGYDDFGYCQQALRYGVSDYLLKPCHPQEILNILVRLKNEIIIMEKQTHHWAFLGQRFQEDLPILRENLLLNLIFHQPLDNEAALLRWNLYQIDVPLQNIGLALIRMYHSPDPACPSRNEFELAKRSLYHQVATIIGDPPRIKTTVSHFHDKILVLWNVDEETIPSFTQRMRRLRQIIETTLPVTLNIGLGNPAADLSQLPTAYHQAMLALEKDWNGENPGFSQPHQFVGEPFVENRDLANAENLILHCLWTMDVAGLTSTLDSFFAHLSFAGRSSKNYIQKMVTALICLVYHACLERGIRTDPIFGPNLAILDELPRIAHLHQLHERILLCFKQIIALHPLQKKQWKMVNQAVNYIEAHYAEDLNLDRIAKIVFVSPGYLSTSFKQVLRKNFVDYVTSVRIRKAKELLKDFHLKIYEIAIQTGYKDEKYFSTIFKKTTGMSPHQYRDSMTDLPQN